MVALRKAKIDDYEEYNHLYSKPCLQWLYSSEKRSSSKMSDKDIHNLLENIGIDMEFINSLYDKTSKQDFQEKLMNSNRYIFIVEERGYVIGYVSVVRIKSWQYRIDEWAMTTYNLPKIRVVMAELEKQIPKAKEFSVCVSNKTAYEILELIGFEADGGGIYKKSRRK